MSDDPILAALTRLEAGQAALQAGQTAMQARQTALEAGQALLRTDLLGELGKTRSDLMERMDRLQHRLDGLDEHLTVGLGHSDRVERKSDGVRNKTACSPSR